MSKNFKDDKQKKSGMIEIRDMLKGELDKFALINTTIKENQEDFSKIDTNYHTYKSEIDKSQQHINKLKRQEFFENLFVYIGFVIFFICVVYVLMKRFPIHRILFWLFKLIFFFVTTIFSGISAVYKGLISMSNTTQSQVSNFTYSNDTRVMSINETLVALINNSIYSILSVEF